MKLLFFDDFKLGVLKGDAVVDVSHVVQDIPHLGPHDLLNGLIERFGEYRPKLEAAVEKGQGVPVSGVRIRPPVPKPFTIVCMAVNYMEDGTRDEPAPINAFQKSPNALIGNGDTMVLTDIPASIFEGEAELALVIGKRASNVKAEDAMDYIFGYMNFIDGSARGVPAFYQMKSRETFAPIGPWLVTADEVRDPQALDVWTTVNGESRQRGSTKDMIFSVAALIAYVSQFMSLRAGDLLSTGTPAGVAHGMKPPRYVQPGDVVEMGITGLGTQRSRIVEAGR